ncbi:DUF3566 domain-containing protein [Actinomycetaceae bacterium WB03_NA08]|uniref:DUF3566 domain-containing protein n=1 Tax=Scrofimicrobium canadense TaxID=2652290 RepID=A0A6N7VUB8_9ACTO|nr:DUF3566 domain-containing protein [Scrofimicrobium canadense]MSS85379.1 DUF3566 domain-containing protein [Scrofimicrobium canadense]
MSDQEITTVEVDQPRRVDLTVTRVDPWSVLKIGFLLAVAVGIITVVATIVLWHVLDGMNVFGTMEDFLIKIGAEQFLSLLEYVRLPRVISYSIILGVANIVIFTALATLMSLLYNLVAVMVGGIRVTLMDE